MSYKFEIYFGRFSKAGLQGPRGVTNSIWPWILHCLHFVSCSNVIYFKTRALNLFLSFLKILFFQCLCYKLLFPIAGSSRFLRSVPVHLGHDFTPGAVQAARTQRLRQRRRFPPHRTHSSVCV